MIGNNIKYSVRSLKKDKGFTLLNILGLALGLTISILIVLYVVDELSYDRYNDKADRIYRVNTDGKFGPNESHYAIAAAPVAEALINNYPEIEKTVRLVGSSERFQKGDELVLEDRVIYSDPAIFDIFSLPMIDGDPKYALKDPNSIVITEKTANKYFNSIHVIGYTLSLINDSNIIERKKITGIIRDIPEQSHFHFDFLLPMSGVPISNGKNFLSLYPFRTYLLLKQGTDYRKLQDKFPALLKSVLSDRIGNMDDFERSGKYYRINLIPLTSIHLQSNRLSELGINGSLQYVQIFSAIALFILLIACINYVNLSTAGSSNRAREVGIRKVLGSSRNSLIVQFLFESVLITLIATLIAFLSTWILLPYFNQISVKNITITRRTFTWIIPSLFALVIVIGVLSGSYPAFFLSSFKPIHVLKGRLASGFKGRGIRSFFVVLQFSISIFLIIGTIVIYNQLNYIKNKSLGFNRKQVLIIKNLGSVDNEAKIFKEKVVSLPDVSSTTLSSFLPTGSRRWLAYVQRGTDGMQTEFWPVDEDYLSTMGINLATGRNFSKQFASDSSAMIINETAARLLGYSDDPEKRTLNSFGKKYHIIGVVKDFNVSSLRDNITPVVLTMMTPFEKNLEGDAADNLCIRINTGNLTSLLVKIEGIWKELVPHQHFEYSFMDSDFDAIYNNEQRMGKIFVLFTSLALLIACLGLFGLSVYATEQRNKEISIRKVLGATVSGIVGLLSRDFIKLVMIAIIISLPTAWIVMHNWLQDFAFRVDIQWWVLATAGFAAVLIALLTITFQSVKAANTNPIKSLRSE
jgi:putative ABC transport system permease protein